MRYWKPRKVAPAKVGVAVAAYLADARQAAGLECLVASLRAQTHPTWVAIVVHDGPGTLEGMRTLKALGEVDPRVEVWETAERKQKFGHPHRQLAVDRLLAAGCDWVGLTNQDNYYVPVYLEAMVAAAQAKKVPLVYCDCVHSHKLWKPMTCRPARGQLDLGGFLAHRSLAEKIKFDQVGFAADADYFERLHKAAKARVEKVASTLFVHN